MAINTGKPVTVSPEVEKRNAQEIMSCCGSGAAKMIDKCLIKKDVLTPCTTLQQMIRRNHEKDGFVIDGGVIKQEKTDRSGHLYLKKINYCPYCGTELTQ